MCLSTALESTIFRSTLIQHIILMLSLISHSPYTRTFHISELLREFHQTGSSLCMSTSNTCQIYCKIHATLFRKIHLENRLSCSYCFTTSWPLTTLGGKKARNYSTFRDRFCKSGNALFALILDENFLLFSCHVEKLPALA